MTNQNLRASGIKIQPTPKLARWIQYLQDNPPQTEQDWNRIVKAYPQDNND